MLRKKFILKFSSISLIAFTLVACSNDSKRFGYETFGVQNSKFYNSNQIQNANYTTTTQKIVQRNSSKDDLYLEDDLIVKNNEVTYNNQLEYSANEDINYFQSDVPDFNNKDVEKKLDDQGLTTSSIRKQYAQLQSTSQIDYTDEQRLNILSEKTSPTNSSYKIIVEEGDTLYKLSHTHGYKVSEIAKQNRLSYPYIIKIGQELVLPDNNPDYTAALSKTAEINKQNDINLDARTVRSVDQKIQILQHTVSKGENLFRISLKYDTTAKEIAKFNDIQHVSQIYAGQTLQIPYKAKHVNKASLDMKATTAPSIVDTKNEQFETVTRKFEIKETLSSKNVNTAKMRWPLSGRIIKNFNIKGKEKNEGINILAPYGTGIRAASHGKVVYADNSLKGYGNLILIRHDNNIVTAYAFNSVNLVKKGDTVERGQIIAKVGSTGSVNQPQLHFEVRNGTKPVNPILHLAKK